MSKIYVGNLNQSIIYLHEDAIDSERVDAHFYHNKFINNEKQLKKAGFDIKPLGEVISKMNSPIGWQGIPSAAYLPEGIGIPLIRVQNVSNLMLDRDTLIGVQEYIYQEQPAIQAEAEDIIITRVGSIGRVCRIPDDVSKIAMGQNLTRVKIDSRFITSEFLTIFMASKYCQLQMERFAYGGVQPSLTNKNIKQLLIPIPSSDIQDYIGNKVRRAEELRDEAKQLREEAERLITTKLGTISFDKSKNKNYSSAFITISKVVERIDSEYYHARYLNIEEEINKKSIEVKTLEEVCTKIINGKTYATSNKQGKYYNVAVGELGDWFISKNEEKCISDTVNPKYCLKRNSIIWGNAAHLAKYIGEKVNIILEGETVIPTTEVTAIEPNEELINPYYLYMFMRSEWGYNQIQRTVKGMTAHSYPQDISKILVPIIELSREEQEVLKNNIITSYKKDERSKELIQQAKQDVEDLIEGNFDMSILNDNSTESR